MQLTNLMDTTLSSTLATTVFASARKELVSGTDNSRSVDDLRCDCDCESVDWASENGRRRSRVDDDAGVDV